MLPLAGGLRVTVAAEASPDEREATYDLVGRDSVFTRVTDFAYAGRDSVLTLRSAGGCGGRAAVGGLRAAATARLRSGGRRAGRGARGRGGDPAGDGFGIPGVWDHAEKLVACELLTPPGNWSSYPPHKHDATEPCRVVNEEIYYYRIGGPDQVTPSGQGFGLHRTYTGAEHDKAGLDPIDLDVEVRDGDVVLVPHGYHGPCVAAPGYPMYYLNVLAGPGTERSMAFCDDPDACLGPRHLGRRDARPALPVTSADGIVADAIVRRDR